MPLIRSDQGDAMTGVGKCACDCVCRYVCAYLLACVVGMGKNVCVRACVRALAGGGLLDFNMEMCVCALACISTHAHIPGF